MGNMSINKHYEDGEEIQVHVDSIDYFHVLKIDRYTPGEITLFVNELEQLEKFAQDILLQVAALKNEQIKNCYVVDTENTYYWWETREQAESWINECKEIHGQNDIRFTYSKCKINESDKDDFEELDVIEVFMP